MSATIQARGLARRFGPTVAVQPLDLDVGPGGVTGLLGPNGSGKSTLMRMLVGLVRPDSGSATVGGVALAGDGLAVRRQTCYTPGELSVYGEMKTREHLAFLLRGREPEALERACKLAERFELPLKRRVRGFSHGMKRTLVFCAAMAPRVPVRILDEPTEGLDPSRRSNLLETLLEDAAQGTTILLSSHHLGEVDHACERLVFVHQGRILADERPAELRRRARRMVELVLDGEVADAEAKLQALGAEKVQRHGELFTLFLPEEDPRAFLAALAAAPDLPRPRSLEYGKPSLRALYRDLYGVEGL